MSPICAKQLSVLKVLSFSPHLLFSLSLFLCWPTSFQNIEVLKISKVNVSFSFTKYVCLHTPSDLILASRSGFPYFSNEEIEDQRA